MFTAPSIERWVLYNNEQPLLGLLASVRHHKLLKSGFPKREKSPKMIHVMLSSLLLDKITAVL